MQSCARFVVPEDFHDFSCLCGLHLGTVCRCAKLVTVVHSCGVWHYQQKLANAKREREQRLREERQRRAEHHEMQRAVRAQKALVAGIDAKDPALLQAGLKRARDAGFMDEAENVRVRCCDPVVPCRLTSLCSLFLAIHSCLWR